MDDWEGCCIQQNQEEYTATGTLPQDPNVGSESTPLIAKTHNRLDPKDYRCTPRSSYRGTLA